jgi:hypothetical protein
MDSFAMNESAEQAIDRVERGVVTLCLALTIADWPVTIVGWLKRIASALT